MIKCPTIYIKKKPAAIITACTLLMLLSFLAIRGVDQPEQPVMSYPIANQIIVIDAGHGGMDPGAISHSKHEEKDITLAISKKLVRYLSQAGATVISLRNNDEDLCEDHFKGSIRERKRKDLSLRVERAKARQADLYISVHTNADVSPQWFGAQTFYKAGNEKSQAVAESIQEEFKRVLGNTKREAKTGSYYILDRATMPAVILEVGFLSNPREADLLISDDYQEKVAYAIFCGIVKSQLEKEKKKDQEKQTAN